MQPDYRNYPPFLPGTGGIYFKVGSDYATGIEYSQPIGRP